MKNFNVSLRSGPTLTLSAAKFQSDGSGVRLFDDNGDLVAAWADGQIISCVPADAVVVNPEETQQPEE
ncbi:hypothetical protein [Ochrobactrum sp. Marseille-Q0166]|uniref:hypothetical protein n=1 Tax=Ochrobactrum sp. Marseille-Q0166 TaxID=2761105 RepID=UPI001655177F|nr:hypothetical protein [Ochrobactrum sp. Marseille-Q0166]MBC8718178.1 hypothetical protein [Ochrobactrum sp. Marseille-Q0166]